MKEFEFATLEYATLHLPNKQRASYEYAACTKLYEISIAL